MLLICLFHYTIYECKLCHKLQYSKMIQAEFHIKHFLLIPTLLPSSKYIPRIQTVILTASWERN